MKKSAFISDVLFAFFLVFILSVCVFRYLKLSLPLSAILAALGGGAAAMLVGLRLKSKRKNFFLKKAEEREKEKLLLHLALLPLLKQRETFGEILKDTNELAFVKFTFSPLETPDVGEFIRSAVKKRTSHKDGEISAAIYCAEMEERAKNLCERFGISVITGEAVYLLFKEHNALPREYLGEETFLEKKKRQLSVGFSKNNSRRFFVGGSLILFTSLVTPFPYYYLITGSALLIVALFVRIFGKR